MEMIITKLSKKHTKLNTFDLFLSDILVMKK